MRADRLIGLLMLLQSRGRMTADRLATELEVSKRTILRDVEALGLAGVPIYTVRGVQGGVELLDGFRTELTGLNSAEAQVLLLAGQPGLASQLGFGETSLAARLKLLNSLTPEHRRAAEELDEWLYVAPPNVDDRVIQMRRLPRLVEAVRTRRVVRVRMAGEPPRRVDPLGLVLTDRGWQLVTSEGDALEVAALDELRLLNQIFERPAGFDLQAAWATRRRG